MFRWFGALFLAGIELEKMHGTHVLDMVERNAVFCLGLLIFRFLLKKKTGDGFLLEKLSIFWPSRCAFCLVTCNGTTA